MDPTLTLGTRKHLTSLDVAALKDIGWTVVPEPSVLYLLALGGSGVLLLKRRSSGTAR
ncbi:MAG: PEP-CTERM sorting domain-containing protein [Verrucomicrobia bacterium]|nr:PEP-CTERM sorting domain-containing protein [Verrucomicrobiota bacterium]